MRILLSANDHISERTMNLYLKKLSIDANLITASDPEIITEIISLCKIDVLVYYAENMEQDELINYIAQIYKLKWDILFVLLTKSENSEGYAEALEIYADEFILLPVDPKEFHIKFRRLNKKFELKKRELSGLPPIEHLSSPLKNDDFPPQPAIPREQYIPPQGFVQESPAPAAMFQQKAENQTFTIESHIPGPEINAGFPETGLNFPAFQQESEMSHDKKRKKRQSKKTGSPLRNLNKTELLEIIYDQEKRLQNPSGNAIPPIKD